MSLWTMEEAVAATGGASPVEWSVTGVSIDTRTLAPGELFVALKDVRDGHDFVAQALEKGAGAALVSRVPDGVAKGAPLLIVDDVLQGLEALGRAARARTDAHVIGVTGSAGKTSTKEMLRAALKGQGNIHAAEKSYNNHWGVPLTLARMPRETDFAIIEIGMNHPGEIKPLAIMAKLDVAIITTVAPAHLEAFKDVMEIAHEKADIFEGLMETGGVAVYNADLEMSEMFLERAPFQARAFGYAENAMFRLCEATPKGDTTVCEAEFQGDKILFKIAAPGRHFAMNGLAALAAIDAADGDLGQAATALGNWLPPEGRGRRRFIQTDPTEAERGIELFDDAYNANPASVAASLDVLGAVDLSDPRGQRIAILGDMKELGPTGPDLHAALAAHPAMEHIGTVHTVGPLMKNLHEALPAEMRGRWVNTSDELTSEVRHLAGAGDIVLVKGSLSMKMAAIVDAITNLGQAIKKK